jgi:hypothetical protein
MKLLIDPDHLHDFNDTSSIWGIYNYTFYILTGILILIQGFALWSIIKGSKCKVAIRLISGYLLCNFCNLILQLAYQSVDAVIDAQGQGSNWFWFCAGLSALCLIVSYMLFNATAWYFGFSYF